MNMSIDGVLGIRTRVSNMECADEPTGQWTLAYVVNLPNKGTIFK